MLMQTSAEYSSEISLLLSLTEEKNWNRLTPQQQNDLEIVLLDLQRKRREADLAEKIKDKAAERKRLLASYERFYRQAWEWTEPGFPLIWSDHQELICKYLEALQAGKKIRDLVMNLPPGCGKSVNAMVIFVAWCLAKNPKERIIKISYDEELLVDEQGEKLRNLMDSDWYQAFFGDIVQIDPSADRKKRFVTTAGGYVFCTTPMGKLTGRHPSMVLIDDPHNVQQAESDKQREKVVNWCDKTLTSRGAGATLNRRRLVVMQRLHEKDLSGHLLAKGWTHLCLPMRYEPDRMKDIGIAMDKRVQPGQLLWEAMFPEEKVRELERDLGEDAAGQLQQRPVPSGGSIFKVDRIHLIDYDAVPFGKIQRFIRGWDKAATQDGGCYTAGVLIGILELPDNRQEVYIIDVIRHQWSIDKVEANIKLWAKMDAAMYGSRYETVIEEEGGSAGKQAAMDTMRNMRGLPVRVISTGGKSKPVRWKGLANAVFAYEVYLVSTKGGEPKKNAAEFLNELQNQPRSEFKDCTDSGALAYNEARTSNWFSLPDPEEEGDGSTLAAAAGPCENKGCDRLAREDDPYCCDCCRDHEEAGRDVAAMPYDVGHENSCNSRHGGLARRDLWTPNSIL